MVKLRVDWLLAGALAGCDPGPPPPPPSTSPADACRRALDRQMACAEGVEQAEILVDRDRRLESCVEDRFAHPDDFRAMRECAEQPVCSVFRECSQKIARRVGNRSRMVHISAALRERKDLHGALSASSRALDYCLEDDAGDPEMAALCDELYAMALGEFRRELVGMRDSPPPTDDRCAALQKKADRMSSAARDEVRVLCEEIDAARAADHTLSNVMLAKSYETQAVPASCAATIEQLDRLATPWAQLQREAVVTECYVEYGASLLPRLTARRGCSEIEEVARHLGPRATGDKARALAKAVRACPQIKGTK